MKILFPLVIAWFSACAPRSAPVDRPWIGVQSRHFAVHTDLAQDDATKLVRDFEESCAAFMGYPFFRDGVGYFLLTSKSQLFRQTLP